MQLSFKKNIPFMKYRHWFFGLSILLMVASVLLLWVKGVNYGTDFKGGLKLIYQIHQSTDEEQVTATIDAVDQAAFVVQRYGEAKDNTFVVKSDLPDLKQDGYTPILTSALINKFGSDQVTLLKEEFVGPKVGKELRTKGIYAMVWAWIVMLIYIGFRFDFYFAPGAIFALIHDVLLSLGAFALTQREVNLTVLAAFLTIVGYSINDTIIVFDRIRENIQKHKGTSLIEIIDSSMTQVLVRSIITSLTVFFVVVVLFFRAEGDIQNFAFAMIWGVIAGSYSSIFVATPIYLFLRQHGHRFGFKKPAKALAK